MANINTTFANTALGNQPDAGPGFPTKTVFSLFCLKRPFRRRILVRLSNALPNTPDSMPFHRSLFPLLYNRGLHDSKDKTELDLQSCQPLMLSLDTTASPRSLCMRLLPLNWFK